jgi:hypothetical protein
MIMMRIVGAPLAKPKKNVNVSYHGGSVETAPHVFLVLWGLRWNNNDPSGEASILQSFYKGVGS